MGEWEAERKGKRGELENGGKGERVKRGTGEREKVKRGKGNGGKEKIGEGETDIFDFLW